MNEAANVKNERQSLPSISAEELETRFDAGEDVSKYFDWDKAVMVQPGELSSGQKLSLIEGMIEDLLKAEGAVAHLSSIKGNLNVSLPALVLAEIGTQAARHHLSREALVQFWIEQKLEEQKAAK